MSAAEWPAGLVVERHVGGVDRLRGRVAFVEAGWIYWAADDGRVHASRADAVRKVER